MTRLPIQMAALNRATEILLQLTRQHWADIDFESGYIATADEIQDYWNRIVYDVPEAYEYQWYPLVCEDMKRPFINWVHIAQIVNKDLRDRGYSS